jgi:hypothetical protein
VEGSSNGFSNIFSKLTLKYIEVKNKIISSYQHYSLFNPFIRRALGVADNGDYPESPQGMNLICKGKEMR